MPWQLDSAHVQEREGEIERWRARERERARVDSQIQHAVRQADCNSISKIQIKLPTDWGESNVTASWMWMWAWLVAYKYAEIKLPEVEKSQTSETHKSGALGGEGNFKRPKRNQRNCYRYLTVYWCVALAEFIGLVDGRFRCHSPASPPPALSDHIQMEMQNVKFEKRAKRLKLIRLGVFGTGCPGTTASHFSKRTEGQGTDITSRLALSFFRSPFSAFLCHRCWPTKC